MKKWLAPIRFITPIFLIFCVFAAQQPARAFTLVEIPVTIPDLIVFRLCKDAAVTVSAVSPTIAQVHAVACGVTEDANFTVQNAGGQQVPSQAVLNRVLTDATSMCNASGPWNSLILGSVIKVRLNYPAFGMPTQILNCD